MEINRLRMTSVQDKSTTVRIQILILIQNIVSILDMVVTQTISDRRTDRQTVGRWPQGRP
jgi:hypothetical protein